jgi:CheY-like chemotaxis protein
MSQIRRHRRLVEPALLDLVFCDLRRPGAGGREATPRIRRVPS